MRPPLNHEQRVLRMLRHAGGLGLTQSDVVHNPPDGGEPVLRLAAVVLRLRAQGYRIDSSGRRKGGQAVYVLLEVPARQERDAA